jgi:hypothetical protein
MVKTRGAANVMTKYNILIVLTTLFGTETALAQHETESNEGSPEVEAAQEEAQSDQAPDQAQEDQAEKGEIPPEPALKIETGAGEPQAKGSGDKEERALGALDKEPGFKIGARLYGMWMMRDEYLQPANEFRVNMARVSFEWTQWKLIEAVIDLDADQLIANAGDTALLRDMYVRVQPLKWLGAQMGQFKRPFSRIEIMSRRRLPVIDRGIANDYIVEHLMYGGRDIGLMLAGRLWDGIRLDYAVGVFNGMGMNTREIGLDGFKDVAARLDLKPAKWLSLGFSGSFKFIEDRDLEHFIDLDDIAAQDFETLDPNDYPEYVDPDDPEVTLTGFKKEHEWMTGMSWMAGMDLSLKFGKFSIAADGMVGENWWFEKYPYVWATSLMVSYKKKLVKGWPLWIEPVVMGEVLTLLTDWSEWRNRMWQVAPGVNLHIGKYVRLMIDGEFTFVEGVESDIDGARWEKLWPNEWPGDWTDSKRLLVQLAFSI